jgi:serine/threonine-protein kinase
MGRVLGVAALLLAVVGTSIATQVFLSRRASPAAGVSAATESAPVATAPPARAVATQPPPPAASTAPAVLTPPGPLPPALLPSAAASTAPPVHVHHGGGAAGTPSNPGFFTFDTYPWTRVTEGGTVLGTTPLIHVALSAGTHNLMLDNPDQGIHQAYTVTIKAGDTVTKRLGLK